MTMLRFAIELLSDFLDFINQLDNEDKEPEEEIEIVTMLLVYCDMLIAI